MKRYKQNLSNYKLLTCDMGQLVPVQLQEVLPGDTFRMETSALIRANPMLAPVMHPVVVRFHHWFVPNRILWDGWEDFITGGPDNDNSDTVPLINIPASSQPNSVADYFGIPADPSGGTLSLNALPFYAYQEIYNEFYRDQDLSPEMGNTSFTTQIIAWGKDYFTTARPWPQKGEALEIPIGASAPVDFPERWLTNASGGTTGINVTTDGAGNVPANAAHHSQGLSGTGLANTNVPLTPTGVTADLTSATGINAIQFREFFALQRYAEARAQYGSRYSEYLRYLGVTPSDARLQRPEYLGGGKQYLQFSEVLQTTPDDNGVLGDSSSVGTMRGHGITALKTRSTRKFFEEHGHVITLMSVLPRSIYQDGVQRNWLRQDKEDYFQKELQTVGQQVIKQGEVYADSTTLHDTFGYSDRYSEYTNTPSTVSGEFRNILDFWHLARKFETPPALNSEFVKCNPTKRIFAEQTQHSLLCMINNKTIARRPVKKQSIGRLM